MTGPRIAPLREEDREPVEALLRATGSFSGEEVHVALEVLAAALGAPNRTLDLPPPDYLAVGAYDRHGVIAGYAAYGPTPDTDRAWDLYWIAVHPAAQGQGVGAALLHGVERDVLLRRGRVLVVETSSREEYAGTRRFYERFGYAERARIRDFYSPGDDRIVFTRPLGAPVPSLFQAVPGVPA